MRGRAVELLLIVGLSMPLLAQDHPSPRDLESNFSNAVSYEVLPNDLMTPKFTADDHICEMSFYKLPRMQGGEKPDLYIPDADVTMIAMMWASPETKGTGLNGSAVKTQTVISGNVKTTVYNYEHSTMRVSGRNNSSPPTFVLIQWKDRTCKDPASKNPKEARSVFQLLPGYKMTLGSGGFEDGENGTIWKEGGPTIDYWFNLRASPDVESIPKDQEVWREVQTSGINRFVFVYTRSQELVVSMIYPTIGGFRVKIHNQKDLADALLTILSTDLSRGYPIDPTKIVPMPPPKN